MKYLVFVPVCAIASVQPAQAQDLVRAFDPPVKQVDEKGMDLVSGNVRIEIPLAVFGEGAGGLSAEAAFTYGRDAQR